MSTNARKHAARNYQRTHHVPYTEALRAVTHDQGPAAAGKPHPNKRFLTALAIDDPSTYTPQALWRQHDPDRDLIVPIAAPIYDSNTATAAEPDFTTLRINAANSTIALVGQAGSGKSAALKTLALAACATHSPQRVTFVLAGANAAVLTDIAELPHIVTRCFERSDDGQPNPRLSQWCAYLDDDMDHRTKDPQARLPEMVLVIDAIEEFLDRNPHAAATLQRALDHGRELGIRTIFSATTIHATEASAWNFCTGDGAMVRVTPDTAIALATVHSKDSVIAVGHPDAWTISLGLGHAYLRRSGGNSEGPFQLLHAGDAAATISRRIAVYQER